MRHACADVYERSYALRDKVNELLPDNDYNINPKDLSKLDCDSFSKRLFFWEENDAPVQGKRFYEYMNLARAFHCKLPKGLFIVNGKTVLVK